MQRYDFTTHYDRAKDGSVKWNMMYDKKKVSEGIVPLSVADMEFITAPEIREGLCDYIKNHILGYTDTTEDYRKSVVSFFKQMHGYHSKPEWIVTTPGIVEALATAVRAVTQLGEGVIIMTPVYPPFYGVVENQGRRIERCPLINSDNYFEIDFGLLETLASKEDVKLLLFCSPHNPGGRVWRMDELERVAEICERHDIVVASDEIHCDIVLPGHKHHVFSNSSAGAGKRSIICTAASKTFNIAGLACSNIFIENGELRSAFTDANRAIGIEGANVLGLVATRYAYDLGREWLEEMKVVINKNHRTVEEFFSNYEGKFKVMKPEAGFLSYIEFKETGIGHEDFMKLLEEADLFVNDGTMFGREAEYYFRMNLGVPTAELERALSRFERAFRPRR